MPNQYHETVIAALKGRTLPETHNEKQSVLSIMGHDLGFPEDDVHHSRFYRVFLTLDSSGVIQDAIIRIDGDLISPCSGYFPEVLDQFDYEAVLNWCLSKTR